MARVRIGRRHVSGRGKDITCGKCGEMIQWGAQFKRWDFRYGGKHIRCMKPECAPRPGDLTQSKMGEILNAQYDLSSLTDAGEVKDALEAFAETVREIAGEYEAAAEPFGGAGENQDRYEALDSWADDIDDAVSNLDTAITEFENAATDEPATVECEHCGGKGQVDDEVSDSGEVLSTTDCPECEGSGEVEDENADEDDDEAEGALADAVEEAKGVAEETPI